MKFKINVKCCKCDCSFQLSPNSFLLRDSLTCPNCGQLFPQAEYESLKQGISALGSLPNHVTDQPCAEDDIGSIFAENGFDLFVGEESSRSLYPGNDSFAAQH